MLVTGFFLLSLILFSTQSSAECQPPSIPSQDLAYKQGDTNKTIAFQLSLQSDCPAFVSSKAVIIPPSLTDVVVINFERTLNGDTTSLNIYASAEMNNGEVFRANGWLTATGSSDQKEGSIVLKATDGSIWGSDATFNSVPGLIVLDKMVFTKLD